MTGHYLKVRRHAIDPRYQDIGPGLMARYDLGDPRARDAGARTSRRCRSPRRAPRAGTPAFVVGHGRRRWFGLDHDATPKRFRDVRPGRSCAAGR